MPMRHSATSVARSSATPSLHRLARMSVTLLFTDIEGSTRLVQELGDGYAAALEQHRIAVRAALAAHAGEEIDCRGDEFSSAFGDPGEALAAAEAIQKAPIDGIRVRIGIHTGEPIRIDGGYVGLDVHRAARICAAGHGGQVLVSQVTAGLVPGVSLRDLGEHHLRGVDEPERLHQLGAADFPALRADAAEVGLGARTRIVLADDSVLLREGIARLLEDAGFEIVGQAGNADELMLKVRSYSPDVAIVDIRMPPTHTDEGLVAAKEIREKHPGTGVLVLSAYVESGYALELLQGNAEGVGYLLKDRVSDVKEFAAAVKRVADGGSALDSEVVSRLVGRRRGEDPVSQLTPREREVLELMAEGRSNQAIAERMVVTLRAVEKHVTSIFNKLGLPSAQDDHRRVLAVLTYLRQ
jgi:DNA-binding NarL/FixJ family response regulator/class 3 adenylate cyclase